MKNPDFLKKKYDLHNAPEVEASAKRTQERTGEKVPQDPEARIKNYLDRLEKLVLDPNKEQPRKMIGPETRPRALSLLREMVMNKYVRSNKEKMAEGAARVEERAARDMGIEAHYGGEQLEQRGNIAVTDLEKSLDNWISYLSDANEPYPMWFRYYAFRNVLDLGDYDKDKGEFSKRSEGTVKLFPDIDRGALAYIEQMIEAEKDQDTLEHLQKAQQAAANGDIPKNELITKEKVTNFAKLSFAKQYAEAIKQSGEITPEMRKETRGKWVKYGQGTDPTALWSSLQNKGTAWCTKGFGTAKTQLEGGDFYVYYTLDKQGKPTIPRIAIRMNGENIGEVRGVADNQQNLEGNMTDIAEEKMNTLPGKERYQKISKDMKEMTAIYKKSFAEDKKTGEETYLNPNLSKEELTFLYEIDNPIEGFGYKRDLRIKEIRDNRNPEQDMLTIFECTQDQIAHNPKEINENTKAYLGQLQPGIFTKLQEFNIERVYTSFPEGKIRKMEVEIGGKTKEELLKELKDKKININDYAKDMLQSKDFTILKKAEDALLVRLKISDLFSDNKYHTTDEIYQKAQQLGLELCPAEVGPQLRLNYQEQPLNEWVYIGMKQIADRGGSPGVFELTRGGGGLWLRRGWAAPDYGWAPGDGVVFRLRKVSEEI